MSCVFCLETHELFRNGPFLTLRKSDIRLASCPHCREDHLLVSRQEALDTGLIDKPAADYLFRRSRS